MNWREFAIRVAFAILFLLFAIHNAAAVAEEPGVQDSPARQIMWAVSSGFFFLAALALPLLIFLPGGKIKWLRPWNPSIRCRILVIAIGLAGVSLYVAGSKGIIDVEPVWFRLMILWSSFLPAIWVILAYLEGQEQRAAA